MLRVQVLVAAVVAALSSQGAEGKQVVAVFSEDNVAAASVRGQVVFTQEREADPVTIDVDLQGLRYGGADGNTWHIHYFPVTDEDCSAASVGGHYNPPASCTEIAYEDRNACRGVSSDSLSTPDACLSVTTASQSDPADTRACRYEPASNSAGELSSNIGNLDGGIDEDAEQTCDGSTCTVPRAYSGSHTDTHLSLFGDHSIVGRSIVIHRNEPADLEMGSARFACATIGQMRVATATFAESSAAAGPVRGTVTFSGVQGGPTVIDIALNGLENGPNPWHIHERALSEGARSCDASETGAHFNPPSAPSQGELSTAIGNLDSPITLRQGATRTYSTGSSHATFDSVAST